MKKVLVTGGTGFVGANLIHRLIKEGHEVHLLVRPGYKSWRIEDIREHLHIHMGEILDFEAITNIVAHVRPEWIFHLAVYGAYPDQIDIRQIMNTNILGTVNLVEACMEKGFEAFVNTGSSSEYGLKDHAPPETERVDPNSNYAVSKVAATLFCRYISINHDIHLPTLRLSSVYGPYEDPTRLMPTLIVKGLNNELPALVEPNIARDLIYVDDVVDAFLKAASARNIERGTIYNVGTGVQKTLRDIVEIARKTLNIEPEPQWETMPNRLWDTTTWLADNRKITKELDWHPKYTFEQGFQSMADWFCQSTEMLRFYRLSSRLVLMNCRQEAKP